MNQIRLNLGLQINPTRTNIGKKTSSDYSNCTVFSGVQTNKVILMVISLTG